MLRARPRVARSRDPFPCSHSIDPGGLPECLTAALTCRHYTSESNAESAALPDRDRQEIVPYRGQTAVKHGVTPTVVAASQTVTAMAFLCHFATARNVSGVGRKGVG